MQRRVVIKLSDWKKTSHDCRFNIDCCDLCYSIVNAKECKNFAWKYLYKVFKKLMDGGKKMMIVVLYLLTLSNAPVYIIKSAKSVWESCGLFFLLGQRY